MGKKHTGGSRILTGILVSLVASIWLLAGVNLTQAADASGSATKSSSMAVVSLIHVATTGSDATGDGLSWAAAKKSISAALSIAAPGDEVWVAAGVYTESIAMKDGVALYGGFSGTETQRQQRNWATNVTTIDGSTARSGLPAYHVVVGANNAILDGFTITGGNASGTEEWGDGSGGGMYNHYTSPVVANSIFSGNSASMDGGGIFSAHASPTVINSTFSGNSAGLKGGGMYSDISSPTVISSIFSGNSASNGGGMANFYGSATVTNSIFSGNSATFGGGMINFVASSVTVTNSTFAGNSTGFRGGGMYNYSSSPTVTNSIFWGNGGPGQEIFNSSSSPVVTYSNVQGGYGGTGNINADPLFVNPAAGDYHLQAGSPCIGAGSNAAVPSGITTDYEGDPRIFNGVVDMGADEYVPVELVAETSLGQSLDAGGTVRIDLNIDRAMGLGLGNTMLFDHGLGAYLTSLTYDPSGISILEVRGASPFADYLTVNLQDASGQLSLASFHTQVPGPQGGPVAYLVPRLLGDALHPYDLTLDFLTIVDVVGNRVPQASPTSRTYLRGDANGDGVVDIIDALFEAQVVVKLRALSDLNAVNGASVKWDDGGDVLDIIDALLIAQRVVKLRNSDYTSILSVSSSAFANGDIIPTKYTEDGENVSPPLLWDRVPSNTQALALIMDDPDAPGGLFTHWVLFNLPPDSRELPEAIPTQGQLANGALQGTNDFGTIGYGGPSPPPGPAHRYRFTVYALDTALGLAPGATRQELIAAMRGHVLAQGQLVGTYQR